MADLESTTIYGDLKITGDLIGGSNYTLQIPYAGNTGGSANAYTITLPSISSYVIGLAVTVKIHAASTGASTLNWSGLGAIPIKKSDGSAITNQLKLNGVYTLRYDGTSFLLQGEASGSGNAVASDLLSGRTASTDAGDIVGTMIQQIYSGGNSPTTTKFHCHGAGVEVNGNNVFLLPPAGYYDGGTWVGIAEPDLIAANIKSGIVIGNDGTAITGTFTSDATATAAQMLSGATAYVNGNKVTGNIAIGGNDEYAGWVRGTIGIAPYDGRLHLYIPTNKYYNSTVNTGGQGVFIDDPDYIASNIKAGVNIFGLVGTASSGVAACAQISNLSATVGYSTAGQITLTWTNPNDGLIKGLRIMYKTGGYPTSPTDGSAFYDSNDGAIQTTATLTGLSEGTTYYIRAFAYTYQNATKLYTTTTAGAQVTALPYRVQGQQIFTGSGTFTVPYGVNSIQVFAAGGGGGGAQGYKWSSYQAGGSHWGGGGGGGYTASGTFGVSPNQQFAVIVGAGGAGGGDGGVPGSRGGSSSFGALLSADGGYGGAITTTNMTEQSGGNGGSGGGAGTVSGSAGFSGGGVGGSNGANGGGTKNGIGQGFTTRAFGEGANTLYSGGGGGGSQEPNVCYTGGSGGGGNGAWSTTGYVFTAAAAGQANTGGGGGGSDGGGNASSAPAGGSGIVIVRWGY